MDLAQNMLQDNETCGADNSEGATKSQLDLTVIKKPFFSHRKILANVIEKLKKSRLSKIHHFQEMGYQWSFLLKTFDFVFFPFPFVLLTFSWLICSLQKLAPHWRPAKNRDSEGVGGGKVDQGGQIQHGQQVLQQVL